VAFNIFGSDKTEHNTSVYQTTNVGVEVNPAFHFGPEFLQPLAQTLGQINQGIVDNYAPLAGRIQDSLENANRLAVDLRRTADFSLNPAIARAPQGPSPVLLFGLALLTVWAAKKML
jgi:hypothetical protein